MEKRTFTGQILLPDVLTRYLLKKPPYAPEGRVCLGERISLPHDTRFLDEGGYFSRAQLQSEVPDSLYDPVNRLTCAHLPCTAAKMYSTIIMMPLTSKRVAGNDYTQRDEVVALYNTIARYCGPEPLLIRAVMPIGFTFDARLAAFRKELAERFHIVSIFHIEHTVFAKYTSNNVCLIDILIASQRSADTVTEFVRLTLNDRNEIEPSNTLSEQSDVLLLDSATDYNWNPDFLFSRRNENDPLFVDFKNPTVKLSSLCTAIIRGKAITPDEFADHNEAYSHLIVNIGDIQDHALRFDTMRKGMEKPRPRARQFKTSFEYYELQDNDILMTCRGSEIKTALFHRKDFDAWRKSAGMPAAVRLVASLNIIIIRINEKSDYPSDLIARYVSLFFKLDRGKKLLQLIQRGSTIINVNPNDVSELDIPLPDPDTMFSIVHMFEEQEQKVKNAMKNFKNTSRIIAEQML